MKRLLCLISGMNAGGAETFLMKIYRALDKDEYQMDFCINIKEKCFYEDEILEMGGKIYRIPSKSENGKLFSEMLKNIVSENSYKYVFRITSNAMGFMDLKIAKQAGAKVCVARSSNSSDGGGIKVFIAHRLGRLFYQKYVDVKFAPSDLAAKYTFGNYAYNQGKVAILHNAIDVDKFAYSEQGRDRIRTEFNISKDSKVFGHIGRFSTQKNHGFLLDIFNEIQKTEPNAVLMLIGKGEMEAQIQNRVEKLGIENKVIFTGIRSDVQDMLSAMDAFVFPSLYEGMPNTVIEAQANGLPCFISDTITKEADITGLVKYMPLSDSAKSWSETILSSDLSRKNCKKDFIKSGYNIESVVENFTKLVFKE